MSRQCRLPVIFFQCQPIQNWFIFLFGQSQRNLSAKKSLQSPLKNECNKNLISKINN